MKSYIKLQNLEEKITDFEEVQKALLRNNTKEIYLPVVTEDRFWIFVGNSIIVIQENNNKIKAAFFISKEMYYRIMEAPIIIKIERIRETVKSFSDDLEETVKNLKYECERIKKKAV